MNLIGNTCSATAITKYCLKEKYSNPFCWNVIDFESFYNLIENYDTLNYKNYELVKDDKWNFFIIIDNKVKIWFPHYRFDKNCKTIKIKEVDVYWCRIWEYIVSKYEERLKRMNDKHEEPIFIISSNHPQQWFSKDQLMKIIKMNSKYKIIISNGNMLDDLVLPSNIIYHKSALPIDKSDNNTLGKEIFNTEFGKLK